MRGRPFTYPWPRWFSRKNRLVLKSADYRCTQSSMCVMIRQQARLHQASVSVFPKSDGSIHIVPKK